jgi:hypothetical protein
MSISPLYDSLKKDIDSRDLSLEHRDELVQNIKLLDEKGSELMFIIIKLFEMEHNPDATTGLPLDCKFVAKEYRFDLEKLPFKLKHILFKFGHMYVKNMVEENIISTERKILNV